MPRYIDADELLCKLRDYRKHNEECLKDISTESYHDMQLADISMGAFYSKMRDLLKDLVTVAKYEERIEVIDLMIIHVEEQVINSTKGEYGAGSF